MRQIPKAGLVGLVIATGLAAYGATAATLRAIRNRQERIRKEQALAADLYRIARANFEEALGRPMTGPEHRVLAAQWRDKLPKGK